MPAPIARTARLRRPCSRAHSSDARMAERTLSSLARPPSAMPAAWITKRAGSSPAPVTAASPTAIGPMRSHSAWMLGPPFWRIAPATPPPSCSWLFAAFTIASTACSVRSPSRMTIRPLICFARLARGQASRGLAARWPAGLPILPCRACSSLLPKRLDQSGGEQRHEDLVVADQRVAAAPAARRALHHVHGRAIVTHEVEVHRREAIHPVAEVACQRERFQEDLGQDHGRADVEQHAALERRHEPSQQLEVAVAGGAERRA